jgi:hypothetical protein
MRRLASLYVCACGMARKQFFMCPASSLQAYTAIDEGQQLDEEAFQQFQRDPVHQVSSRGSACISNIQSSHVRAPTHLDARVSAIDH